jgi:MinD superfamily P-loop ATPase
MKQLTIISGKGGTGKTTLAAAFASIADHAVLADCDVDAADLHLILDPVIKKTFDFSGMKMAIKNRELCTECGECLAHCRFGAIDENLNIIEQRCEGCGVCELVCPEEAIKLLDRQSGRAYNSTTRFGPMAHAVLNTAEEASGKLVSMVRNNAKEMAENDSKDLVIVDGPPGIGCPVIAAITGVDLVLIITEPTISGSHDLKRILGVTDHFQIPCAVCINKCDINREQSKAIQKYCHLNDIPVVGLIPYDEDFTKAMIQEQTIIEFSDNGLSDTIRGIWDKILNLLEAN